MRVLSQRTVPPRSDSLTLGPSHLPPKDGDGPSSLMELIANMQSCNGFPQPKRPLSFLFTTITVTLTEGAKRDTYRRCEGIRIWGAMLVPCWLKGYETRFLGPGGSTSMPSSSRALSHFAETLSRSRWQFWLALPPLSVGFKDLN